MGENGSRIDWDRDIFLLCSIPNTGKTTISDRLKDTLRVVGITSRVLEIMAHKNPYPLEGEDPTIPILVDDTYEALHQHIGEPFHPRHRVYADRMHRIAMEEIVGVIDRHDPDTESGLIIDAPGDLAHASSEVWEQIFRDRGKNFRVRLIHLQVPPDKMGFITETHRTRVKPVFWPADLYERLGRESAHEAKFRCLRKLFEAREARFRELAPHHANIELPWDLFRAEEGKVIDAAHLMPLMERLVSEKAEGARLAAVR